MGCLTGSTLQCDTGPNSGSVSAIKIIGYEDATFTETTGQYSAATLTVGEFFGEYEFDPDDEAQFKETASKTDGHALTWEQMLMFNLGRMSNAARTAIMEFLDCGCGVIVAVQLSNGGIIIFGENPLYKAYLSANEADSGAKFENKTFEKITITAEHARAKAKYFSGAWADLATS